MTPICFVGSSCFIIVIRIYLRNWCQTWYTYQVMFVSSNRNTASVTCEVGTSNSNTASVTCEVGTVNHSGAPRFTSGFSGVRVSRSLVFCVVFCRSLFVLLSCFFLSYCVSFFDLLFLITPFCLIVCPSSTYCFWLPLWYLQTVLNTIHMHAY